MKYYFFSACTVVWIQFFFRSWRAEHLLQRYEGMILRPLCICIDLLGLYYLLHRSWWAGAFAVCWGLLIGVVASSTLRREDSIEELAKAYQPNTSKTREELSMLSVGDSNRLGMAILQVGTFSLIFTSLLFLNRGWRWYMALAAGVVTGIMIGPVATLICCSTALLMPTRKANPRNDEASDART